MKKIIGFFLVCLYSFLVTGCAAPVAKQTSIELTGDTVTYTIPSGLFENQTGAFYAFKSAYARGAIRTTGLNSRAFVGGTSDIEQGVTANETSEGITLLYLNQSIRPDRSIGLRNNLSASFKIEAVKNSSGDIAINVRCPSKIDIDARTFETGIFSGTWNPIIPYEQAKNNIAQVCHNTAVEMARRYAGEMNINFPESSIFSNFERKLSGHKASSYDFQRMGLAEAEAAKYKWFYVMDGNMGVTIALAVYPYRSGSKVNYTYVVDSICSPNSSCLFDKNRFKRIDDYLRTIAND